MPDEVKHTLKEVAHRISAEEIKIILPEQIFVFGSNEGGRHGKGAAKQALTWGAKWGQAAGLQGRTYGIPTKDKTIRRVLSVNEIKSYVDDFIVFARENAHLTFLVTEIGCGLSKMKPKDIAPLFEETIALENVHLPVRFWHKLGYSNNE